MVTKIQYKCYNGWRGVRPDVSGWATWNVALWLNNDEGLYRAYRDFARNHKGRLSGADAEDFVRKLLPNGTPDMKENGGFKCYRQVHWPSIAAMFREARDR